MSVLIKGMEMPKDCRDCPMEMYYMNCGDTRCRATNKLLAEDNRVMQFDGRPDWCPLVEVPTPHGRLIDVDKLKEYHSDFEHLYVIDDAPTIIEAEEGEDE